jgi:DNA-binding NtrC family response regulator/predicted ATPase/class 3 adenylate cyclase
MASEGWQFLGDSAPVREILASVTRVQPILGLGRRVPPVLLQGETGTGKGLLARTIHETGPRAAGPFVDLNCAAIPATLIEAELFGFERGAFTDARQARTGLVEAAHRGTLFLDEIGLVPEGLQAKLLTVLETREVRPLGGTRARAVDVSIIAATNSDLREAVSQRRFREDLYHRLAVLVFSLPPLRERGNDVLELAEAFLGRACADHALKKKLAEDARAAIAAYRWPGNVRELANLMERVALLTEGSIITAADLALPAVSIASTPTDRELPDVLSLKASVDTFTRARVEQALNEARGNISAAAEQLGVPRSTLRYQLERFGLTQGGMGRARRRTAPVTPALSDRVLARARPVEGERRQVTVLFADFTEAMDRVAGGDPEATRALFDPVLETMIDAIRRHEGSINHVRDDGLMALFGAPVAHEDHAVRACYAALSMHESVGRLAEGMRSSLGADITIRIGLHSGDVALRVIGNEVRLDYAAIPETTRVAARTVQAAWPGSSLITAETFRLAEGFIEVAPAAPANVYELSAPSVVRSRLRAAIARSLSQFVGRDAETEQIRAAMDRARSGRGQVVALVGEPGVGKSRLVYELTHSHLAQEWLVLEATALSYGKATSYLPVIELLKKYFKITERETHREIREKVTGKLLALGCVLEPILAAVLTLLDVPAEDSQWHVLDPSQRRERILEAIKQLVLRESRNQPVLVVFEDLHWVDAETQAFLDRLVEVLPTARLLLIASYRPEYEQRWAHKTYYTSLRIDPLDGESAAELVRAMLGSDPSLQEIRRILIERTQGNPFFLEESIRTLAETHVVVGERGRYRLGKAIAAIPVPSTVQAVLAARIDRLCLEDKRLLQSAAVIGRDVPSAQLQAIGDASADELHTSLRRLQAAEFLYETGLFPEIEYTFKHALTHDVAYRSLLHEQRRLLHARIVDAIESLYGDRLSEQVEGMAHHAVHGEVWDRAVAYCRQAGAKAMTRSAYAEAAVRFEQALDALRNLPESRSRTEQAIELHFDASRTLLVSGVMTKSMDHARQAEILATSLGDEHRRGRALVFLMHRAWNMGDSNHALELGREALAIGVGLHDASLEMSANQRLGAIELTRGDFRQAAERLRRVTEQLQDGGGRERVEINLTSVNSRDRLVWCLTQLGEFAEAMARADEATRIAREVDHPSSLVFAYRSLGLVSLRRGDVTQALAPLERAVELCRVIPAPLLFDIGAAHLGYAYTLSGRLEEGVALMEEALVDPAVTGSANHPLFLAHLGEAHLLAGRRDDAIAVARRALDLAQLQKERGNEAWIQRLIGEICAQADPIDLESAAAHYGSALVRAEELRMRPLVAHCHLGLGKLYRRAGRREQAQEHLTTATTMYREMGMTYWLEQAEAEMKKIA